MPLALAYINKSNSKSNKSINTKQNPVLLHNGPFSMTWAHFYQNHLPILFKLANRRNKTKIVQWWVSTCTHGYKIGKIKIKIL